MGKIVAFSNQKGGVGKTTTCVNMAAYLAQKGHKCLIVDLDPQGNATSGLGFAKSEVKNSVYNVMIDEAPIEEAVVKTCVDNLDLLPSNIDLAGAERQRAYTEESYRQGKRHLRLYNDRLSAVAGTSDDKRACRRGYGAYTDSERILRAGRFVSAYEHHKARSKTP